MEFGLLLVRAVVGGVLAAHGCQKLFGWFGGDGVRGTAPWFEKLGFRPAALFVVGSGLAELLGGLGLGLGLLTPFAVALLAADLLVAIFTVHRGKGLFTENGGFELPLIIVAASVAVAFIGPGAASLDRALGLALEGRRWGLFAVGVAAVGALLALAAQGMGRRREASA